MQHPPTAYPKFATELHRRYQDDQELFLAGDQVAELLAHPGWKRVMELIDAAAAPQRFELIHGPIHDQAKYAALTAFLSAAEMFPLAADAIRYRAAERAAELETAKAAERQEAA